MTQIFILIISGFFCLFKSKAYKKLRTFLKNFQHQNWLIDCASGAGHLVLPCSMDLLSLVLQAERTEPAVWTWLFVRWVVVNCVVLCIFSMFRYFLFVLFRCLLSVGYEWLWPWLTAPHSCYIALVSIQDIFVKHSRTSNAACTPTWRWRIMVATVSLQNEVIWIWVQGHFL